MANEPEATAAGPGVLLVRVLDLTETEAAALQQRLRSSTGVSYAEVDAGSGFAQVEYEPPFTEEHALEALRSASKPVLTEPPAAERWPRMRPESPARRRLQRTRRGTIGATISVILRNIDPSGGTDMSETAMAEKNITWDNITQTTEQATAQVPEPAPVSEVEPAEQKPAQDATTRPRIPRIHCAC